MLTAKRRTRTQQVLAGAGLVLALFYLAVYRPLARRAAELDAPLLRVWSELVSVSLPSKRGDETDLPGISDALDRVRRSLTDVETMRNIVAGRIALDPATRERMEQPFQLIEFQNERQIRLEQLTRAAAQRKVTIAPAVARGFPEYPGDRMPRVLLWAQLAFVHHLVWNAIEAPAAGIASVQMLPPQVFSGSGTNQAEVLVELPIQIELTAPAAAIQRFLETLPLRADEIKARGLPDSLPTKPVLFIQHLLMRKVDRDKTDLVQLDLTASGFVFLPRHDFAVRPASPL